MYTRETNSEYSYVNRKTMKWITRLLECVNVLKPIGQGRIIKNSLNIEINPYRKRPLEARECVTLRYYYIKREIIIMFFTIICTVIVREQ